MTTPTAPLTIPTIASTIALINEYATAIADDSATDSTLDAMQFDIDCILFPDDLPADLLDDADYAPLAEPTEYAHFASPALDALRAYAIAAFNMRP